MIDHSQHEHTAKGVCTLRATQPAEDIYVELRLDPVAHVPRVDQIVDLLIARGLTAEPQECLYVVATDPEQVRRVAKVAQGEYHFVAAPLGPILAVPLLSGSMQMVLAHNHPSGLLVPSEADIDLTARLHEAAGLVGVRLTDHLIMAPSGDYWSMANAHAMSFPPPRRAEVHG